MSVYEIAFITEKGDKKLLTSVEEIISQFGGKVTRKDEWGEKPFSYAINGLSKGHYHIWNFTTDDTSRIKELKNRLNQEDDITRYLILKID